MSGEQIQDQADQAVVTANTASFAGSDLVPDISDAYEEAKAFDKEFDDATDMLRDYGVADMASEQINVHGRRMSVAYGMASCKPFKESIEDTVEDLKFNNVTDEAAIQRTLHRKLERQAARAPEALPGDAEKKSATSDAA